MLLRALLKQEINQLEPFIGTKTVMDRLQTLDSALAHLNNAQPSKAT